MDTKVLKESLKEPLREILMAAIPGVLAYLGTIDATWAAILYLLVRALDSYLHEKAKAEPEKTRAEGLLGLRGLTGF